MLSTRKLDTPIADKPTTQTNQFGISQHTPAYGSQKDDEHSIVGGRLTMRGDLESDGDILIRGKVIGNIKCNMLIVDVGASIEGGIDVAEVVVRGSTKGTIVANRVRLEKTAVVERDIEHTTFSAEEGAKIKGALRFKDETSRSSKDVVSLVA